MTQEQLARAVGVSLLTMGKWERGQANATPENLLRLAEVLNAEPEDLGYELPSPIASDVPPAWFTERMDRLEAQNERIIDLLEHGRR